jgi:RNA polymerase sigma-B factor
MAITEASGTLTSTLGRSPTVADIAAHLKTTEEEVLEGLEGAQAYSATSLSTPVGPDGGLELGDTLGADDHEMELAEMRIALGTAMASLGERERRILALRFYGNLTQSEIAEQLGISQMHVSRLIARSLRRLRSQLS